jgi:hypothetical protein
MPGLTYAQEYAANIKTAQTVCAAISNYPTLWQPDMRRDEQKIIFAILIKW